jgi:hypothetical protein
MLKTLAQREAGMDAFHMAVSEQQTLPSIIKEPKRVDPQLHLTNVSDNATLC